MNNTQAMTEELHTELSWLTECMRAWQLCGISEVPSLQQWRVWYSLHTPERMLWAITRTSEKKDTMEEAGMPFSAEHAVKFYSSVANRQKTEDEEQETHNE